MLLVVCGRSSNGHFSTLVFSTSVNVSSTKHVCHHLQKCHLQNNEYICILFVVSLEPHPPQKKEQYLGKKKFLQNFFSSRDGPEKHRSKTEMNEHKNIILHLLRFFFTDVG